MARRPLVNKHTAGIISSQKEQTSALARAGSRNASPKQLIEQTAIDQHPSNLTQGDTDHNARCGAMGEDEAFVTNALDTGDWTGARPKHFVRLYGMLHRRVYGVEARELRNSLTMRAATRFATMQFQNEFNSDPVEMADFMRWCWERELGREEWRRRNGRSGGRIEWRLQFGPSLVTDWRIDVARRQCP
jgi:hypothetical protein